MEQLNKFKTSFHELFNNFSKSKMFTTLALFGLFTVSKSIFKSLMWFKKYFLTFNRDFKKLYGDGWVIITGGSEGVGLALAEEFATRGFKILIISRTEEKLKLACEELRKLPGAVKEIEYMAIDFSKDQYTQPDIDDLRKKLSPYLDASILVNNVGMSQNSCLHKMSDDYIRRMINTNVNSLVWMTKIIIEGMMKRQNRSLIVGSGSVYYFMKPKMKSLYNGSKDFMDGFMSSLARESDKIDYTYMEIGPISTSLNLNKYFNQLESAKPFGKAAMCQLGNYFYTGVYWRHALHLDLQKYSSLIFYLARRNMENCIREKDN